MRQAPATPAPVAMTFTSGLPTALWAIRDAESTVPAMDSTVVEQGVDPVEVDAGLLDGHVGVGQEGHGCPMDVVDRPPHGGEGAEAA